MAINLILKPDIFCYCCKLYHCMLFLCICKYLLYLFFLFVVQFFYSRVCLESMSCIFCKFYIVFQIFFVTAFWYNFDFVHFLLDSFGILRDHIFMHIVKSYTVINIAGYNFMLLLYNRIFVFITSCLCFIRRPFFI